jgi:DNA-binding transcriptional ArsR family regulator
VTTYQVDAWAALSDPTRRAIFARITEEPMAVGQLAATLPVSRPAVSQHLRVLKDAGLVLDRPVGTRRIYQARPEGLRQLRAELEDFWGKTLSSFKELVENTPQEDR